jgi:hypothetical protein
MSREDDNAPPCLVQLPGGRWQHGGGECHTRREARAAYMSDAMIFLPCSAMYDMETEKEELSTRGGAGGWEAP